VVPQRRRRAQEAPQSDPKLGRGGAKGSNKPRSGLQVLPLGEQPERVPSQFRLLQCPRLLLEPQPPVPRGGPTPRTDGLAWEAPQREAVRDFDQNAL